MLELTRRYPRKRAFVTGAASGLGFALCEQLARDRWTIGMADLRGDVLEQEAERIRTLGGQAHAYPLDVTDRTAFQSAVDDFAQGHGGIDLFVNNAGVAGGGPMGEFRLEDWDWLIGINLMGVVNGCHFAVPHLKRQGSGHLINIASAAAFVPVPEMASYCSAKAAVKMLSEVLYNELHPLGIGVTVAMPTFFQTNLHERTRGAAIDRARFMITSSPHTAEAVAHALLDAAGRGRLRMIFGSDVQVVWRLVRWLPNLSMRLIQLRAGRMKAAADRATGTSAIAEADAE